MHFCYFALFWITTAIAAFGQIGGDSMDASSKLGVPKKEEQDPEIRDIRYSYSMKGSLDSKAVMLKGTCVAFCLKRAGGTGPKINRDEIDKILEDNKGNSSWNVVNLGDGNLYFIRKDNQVRGGYWANSRFIYLQHEDYIELCIKNRAESAVKSDFPDVYANTSYKTIDSQNGKDVVMIEIELNNKLNRNPSRNLNVRGWILDSHGKEIATVKKDNVVVPANFVEYVVGTIQVDPAISKNLKIYVNVD